MDLVRLTLLTARSPNGDVAPLLTWAHERFHTGGWEHPVVATRGPLVSRIPDDAVQVEMWPNSDAQFCSAWDSRYGQNYWLGVAPR